MVLPWRDDLRRHLDASDVFAGLVATELAALADAATLRKTRAGVVLFRLGERADALMVVLAGTLTVERGAGRHRTVFRTLARGDVLGFSVVAGAPHSADLVAGRSLSIALVPGAAVRRLWLRHPATAIRVIEQLGHLVATLSDENASLRHDDLRARVERWLHRQGGPGTLVRVTHAELAAAVGASRARVSHVLEALARAGTLRLGRGRIAIVRTP